MFEQSKIGDDRFVLILELDMPAVPFLFSDIFKVVDIVTNDPTSGVYEVRIIE